MEKTLAKTKTELERKSLWSSYVQRKEISNNFVINLPNKTENLF